MTAVAHDDENGIVLTEEQKRRQRKRSVAIALVLAGLMLLFFVLTIVKFGAGNLGLPAQPGVTQQGR